MLTLPKITVTPQLLAQLLLCSIIALGSTIYVLALGLHERLQLVNALAYFFFASMMLSVLAMLVVFALHIFAKKTAGTLALYTSMACAGLCYFCFLSAAAQSQRLDLEDRMTITYGSDYISIRGAIGVSLPDQLKRLMGADFRPDRIYMANSGGSVEGAIAAADFLKSRGTRVAIIDGDCASSCAYMALLFPERLATDAARLGFHDISSFASARPGDADEGRAQLSSALLAAGTPGSLVKGFFTSREISYPTREQLFARNHFTGCWDESKRSPKACTPVAEASASP